MDHRAIIDVVCKAALNHLGGEISALLGHDLTCSDIRLDLTTKDQLFSDPDRGKTALTRMTVSGDREGESYLLSRLAAAATLGGTLIMLPQDMIDEHARKGELDAELTDAFGEIANIIAGVFTQAFVDKYPKTLRFIKKTVETLIPTKIDPASDTPFPPGNYYLASCRMAMAETDLGLLELIVPAALFELEQDAPEEPAAPPSGQPQPAPGQAPQPPAQPGPAPEAATGEPAPREEAPPSARKASFAEQKKLVDVVFKSTISQIGEEIGALLGQDLTCDDVQLLMTSKADFFSGHCLEKSILTHMKVTGDREGLGFMIAEVPDAIIMGGTLIMLPEDQIDEQKRAGQFDGEVADAYGEIANILAGSLTQIFLDRYPHHIRFIKTDTETIVPTKINADAEEPFPEGNYYLASFAVHMDGYELKRLLLLFPAEVFDLDASATAAAPSAAGSEGLPAPGEWGAAPVTPAPGQSQPAAAAQSAPAATPPGGAPGSQESPDGTPLVLVMSDQPDNAATFVEILTSAGYQCRVLSFQDDIREIFQKNQIQGIFLVMNQVGEKGFAAAIKLQSAGRPLPPIIFAGPEWTRSAVLRAVKYGARDILLTPASGEEIQEKITQHLKKAS